MSRKLLCAKCDAELSKLAKRFDELYESVEGISNDDYMCDDCGCSIHEDSRCFAAVLLPNKSHFQYEHQKPNAWMRDYFSSIIKTTNE